VGDRRDDVVTPTGRDPAQWKSARLASILAFVIGLLLLQLWLMTSALEVTLSGESTALWPVILVSGLCGAGSWGLWRTLARY
jgi:hypothetical protein